MKFKQQWFRPYFVRSNMATVSSVTWQILLQWRHVKTLYTTLCDGILSHGAPIGGIRVFTNHTHTQMQTATKCAPDLCAPCSISRMFIFTLRLQLDAGDIRTWWTTVILITGQNPNTPTETPMLEGKWMFDSHMLPTIKPATL